jgi:predicted transcriptional regulator|tara:strand:+ start:340 stop:528 length:189 start_codon:yes stop_codon:yes gene_type:complete
MSDDLMNRTVKEIDILRKQVTQLKKIIENKNIMITKLREELSEVTQDRSNILLSWAEIDDRR